MKRKSRESQTYCAPASAAGSFKLYSAMPKIYTQAMGTRVFDRSRSLPQIRHLFVVFGGGRVRVGGWASAAASPTSARGDYN